MVIKCTVTIKGDFDSWGWEIRHTIIYSKSEWRANTSTPDCVRLCSSKDVLVSEPSDSVLGNNLNEMNKMKKTKQTKTFLPKTLLPRACSCPWWVSIRILVWSALWDKYCDKAWHSFTVCAIRQISSVIRKLRVALKMWSFSSLPHGKKFNCDRVLTMLFSISSTLFAMVGWTDTCPHMQNKLFCADERKWVEKLCKHTKWLRKRITTNNNKYQINKTRTTDL